MNFEEDFSLKFSSDIQLYFSLNSKRVERVSETRSPVVLSVPAGVSEEHLRCQQQSGQQGSVFSQKDCESIWEDATKSNKSEQLLQYFDICSKELIDRIKNTRPTSADKQALLNFLFVIGVVKKKLVSPFVEDTEELNATVADIEFAKGTEDISEADDSCEDEDSGAGLVETPATHITTKAVPEEISEVHQTPANVPFVETDHVKPTVAGIIKKDANSRRERTGRQPPGSNEGKEKKTVDCKLCGKSIYKYHIERHTRTHSEERPYHCQSCPRTFKTKSGLNYHMRTHTGERPFQCLECGMCFSLKYGVKRHMRVHRGEKPYLCEECGRAFTQKHHFKEHLRIHTGEKPYECDICGKRCSRQKDMVHHRRTHTGEKPYICEKCGRTFIQTSKLAKHLRSHERKARLGSPPVRKKASKRKRQSFEIIDDMLKADNPPLQVSQ
ncbi:uncharacterized protein [Ptychodera flava]|uniref:uncharacterized protein n=1 Tax=Ptychodera flava TaxID=63121 RepID=UPI003969FA93